MTSVSNIFKLILAALLTINSSIGIFAVSSSATYDESIFDDLYESGYEMDGGHVADIPVEDYLIFADSYEIERDEAKAAAQAQGYIFIDVIAEGYDVTTTNNGIENAAAINEAVTKASEAGGGTVYISNSGMETIYETGTIYMQSNVTLKIGANTTLESLTYEERTELGGLSIAVIKIYGCDNVTIEGPGTIDAQGQTYMDESLLGGSLLASDVTSFNLKEYNLAWRQYITYKYGSRVQLMRTNNVDGLTVKNITLHDSAAFAMWVNETDNILVENVIIDNNVHTENGDGVDFINCNNVVMHDCFVCAADDGISIKANEDTCINYEIYNCEVTALANCFKIGTPTANEISNIEVYDCEFFRAGIMGGYAGIALESADGTVMSDVYIHDIQMDGVLSPLLIWLGYRLAYSDTTTDQIGSISGIVIENVEANNVDVPCAIVGCSSGLADWSEIHYVEDVTLTNFVIKYREGVTEDLDLPGALEIILAQSGPDEYPEITRVMYLGLTNYNDSLMFDFPVYGLYCRYVKDLTITDFYVMGREGTELPLDNVQSVFDRYFAEDITWTSTEGFSGIDFDV